MIHQRSDKSFMQSVVQHYPVSMLFSLFSSFVWAGLSLSARSSYAIIPTLQAVLLLSGFIEEFKRLIPNPVKIKNHFDTKTFYYHNQLAATLENENNSTPSLEIYSNDRGTIGLVSGDLRGWDYLELRNKYSSFLFRNAQIRKGTWFEHPITTINRRTRERNIDIEYKLPEQHGFMLEVNKKVIEYNLAASPALQQPLVTIDELQAYNHFPDDFKGNLACSVYLPKRGENHNFDMVRNFDWPSAGELFNRFLRVIYRTKHTDSNKPQFVISWTLPTNPGFTATNGHLVLAMNEVETYETMRRNPNGGIGQLDLFNMIIENCCTLEDIEKFINEHQPASPWILIAVEKNRSGIFEMLPTVKENPPLYRFIEANDGCVSTNHFQGIPSSATISCSVSRSEKMKEAAKKFPKNPWEIAASSATDATGITLIAYWDDDGNLVIQTNIANHNSAIATDPEENNKFHYDELNVKEYSEKFLATCERNLVECEPSLSDILLMKLCKLAYKVKDEDIAQCLRDIYSQLMFEKSKIEFNHTKMPSSFSIPEIENIAMGSNNIVNLIFDRNTSYELKLQAMEQYEKTINGMLNGRLSHSTNRLQIILGVTLCMGMMAMLCVNTTGLDLVKIGITDWIRHISATCSVYSASAPLRSTLKSAPNLAFFTQSMAKHLRTQIKKEQIESSLIPAFNH